MTRFLLAPALLLSAALPALAQDMPLSQILIDGEGWKKVDTRVTPLRTRAAPVTTRSADRGTVFIANAGEPFTGVGFATATDAFLQAAPAGPKGKPVWKGVPYAPLRTKRGEKGILVTGLVADRDGRIYAATELGVQVFDPTGRLCGVLTPAAPGTPDHMAFEGDTLTLWVGDTMYARKLSTEGVK